MVNSFAILNGTTAYFLMITVIIFASFVDKPA